MSHTAEVKVDLSPSIIEFFSIIEDPRLERQKKYPLINILIFTFVAILSDQSSWYQIEEFCLCQLDWFSQFLDISSGVPSHDTFRRVLSIVDTTHLETAIIQWLENQRADSSNQKRVISLDGKALRGTSWKIDERKLYVLNGWDATEKKFIGQLTIGDKTNEITAAPKMLEALNLKNTVVTMDALLTQTEIAKKIIDGGGDYVMALKGNQGTLYEDIKLYFSEIEKGMSCYRTVEKNRGQVETRVCTETKEIDWLLQKDKWPGLKSLYKLESEIFKDGKITKEERYYISSHDSGAQEKLNFSRSHWGIENSLHRVLDVHFKEDACQVHDRTAAANLSALRKIALTLLKQIEPKKTLISKLKRASYSAEFRAKCLKQKF